jgi:hypothetical protein
MVDWGLWMVDWGLENVFGGGAWSRAAQTREHLNTLTPEHLLMEDGG